MATQTVHTNGAHAPTEPDHQVWLSTVDDVTQRARKYYGPKLSRRVTKAQQIVLDDRIQPDGQLAYVSSQSDPDTYYTVTSKSCDCTDTETQAPQGICKHQIAWLIYRGASKARDPEPEAPATQPPEPVLVPEPADTGRIPAELIVDIRGKQYVTYTGLLALAQQQGLQSLDVRFIGVQPEMATAIATATFKDGRSFTECGDATPQNVGKNIAPHFARMALTRAKARALRDALNIGMCSVEELAE